VIRRSQSCKRLRQLVSTLRAPDRRQESHRAACSSQKTATITRARAGRPAWARSFDRSSLNGDGIQGQRLDQQAKDPSIGERNWCKNQISLCKQGLRSALRSARLKYRSMGSLSGSRGHGASAMCSDHWWIFHGAGGTKEKIYSPQNFGAAALLFFYVCTKDILQYQ
jgi:hypothetical protein